MMEAAGKSGSPVKTFLYPKNGSLSMHYTLRKGILVIFAAMKYLLQQKGQSNCSLVPSK